MNVRDQRKNALLLGMVYSEETVPKRGQEYRDRVRCIALERLGYNVYTLDNKHSDVGLQQHCNANFSDCRRMMRSIESKWGNIQFDGVFLDYFFSPVGWARERWTDPLFTTTLPALADHGLLKKGATVWLPNIQCIDESVRDFGGILRKRFELRTVSQARSNPLCKATDSVTTELTRCPDLLTNDTQLKPLNAFSNSPFWALELKQSSLRAAPYTPTKLKKHHSVTLQAATPAKRKRKTASSIQQQQGQEERKEDEEEDVLLLSQSSAEGSITGVKRHLALSATGQGASSSSNRSVEHPAAKMVRF